MDDDLRKIATFIRLSKSTALILTQNIVLALGIKAIFLVLTFTGQATMWMAVFADMGASLHSSGKWIAVIKKLGVSSYQAVNSRSTKMKKLGWVAILSLGVLLSAPVLAQNSRGRH